jgi:hypothetical protein
MSFGDVSGYPTWEDYIPEFKTQTLIMSIMSEMAYEVKFKITGALIDDNNYFKKLGTTIFFTKKGKYAVLQPDCGAERVRVSYSDGELVSRYYNFPIPGVNPNFPGFDFNSQYQIGLPPVYSYCTQIPNNNPDGPVFPDFPLYRDSSNCPISSLSGVDSITTCVPNPGQPFINRSKFSTNSSNNVFGYFKPPPAPCRDDPFVIAFHCINNSKATSNNPLDTLQYFQFQTLAIRTKGVVGAPDFGDGVDVVNAEGDLIDREGKPITVIYLLNEVDYFPKFDQQDNPTYGYNLTYDSYVFSFRGSTYLPDFLEEIIPPQTIIADIKLSNPQNLLIRYRPWLVNKATAMYKSIAKTTNFEYFLTPFPEEQSIQIVKNYSNYLGSICFTGHSYGGSLANILAQYLVDRFPLYVNAQTYAFAPVPYIRPCVPPLNPETYIGYLLIRAFVNDNDCVPFLKVPNITNCPEDYLQPLLPTEIYNFYHIKTLECSTNTEKESCFCQKECQCNIVSTCQCAIQCCCPNSNSNTITCPQDFSTPCKECKCQSGCVCQTQCQCQNGCQCSGKKVVLERINSYCFPCGGVPIYLSINKDHDFTVYVKNISKINPVEFEKTILSPEGIENYTIPANVIVKTFVETIPLFPSYVKRTGEIIGVNPLTNPLNYIYRFIGLNNVNVSYKNLLESLKLCWS